jgi:beta-N-acetylhexosaminidase
MKKALLCFLSALTLIGAKSQEKDSLDIMIGQMIMVGLGEFNVLKKSEPIFEDIKSGYAGGIILFEKNLHKSYTETYLKEIIDYAQEQSSVSLFVSIDEEGGRVNRLKPKYGFPKTVTAKYLGELDSKDSTFQYALQTASTLHKLGINMNFAPSVDVNINPQNPIIGKIGRSYSSDPMSVAKHAQLVVQAHDSLNVVTALKHFPGHGSSVNDTHLGLTDVSSTWQFNELLPYKSLIDSGSVRMIMSAHIVNRIVEPEKLPATLSQNVITNILRGFLNYQGVVISDDMQMGAISKEYGLKEAIALSINSGIDIVLFANNVTLSQVVSAQEVHGIIKDLVLSGEITESRVQESYDRIMTLKKSFGLIPND